MIKITEENINKPYFKEIGSLISNYPHHGANTSNICNIFQHGKNSVEYRVVAYNKSRDVLALVSTHSTDSMGVARQNIPRLDLTNGFWWYDPFKDVSDEVEQLFDKFFKEI